MHLEFETATSPPSELPNDAISRGDVQAIIVRVKRERSDRRAVQVKSCHRAFRSGVENGRALIRGRHDIAPIRTDLHVVSRVVAALVVTCILEFAPLGQALPGAGVPERDASIRPLA